MVTVAISLLVAAVGMFLTSWAALVIESLGTAGKQRPYFASECDLRRDLEDDYLFRLASVFIFYDSNGVRWECPKDMPTDGASVGSLLRLPILGLLIGWLIEGTPLTGPLAPAAVPHDYIYGTAEDSAFWRALISMRRAVADRVIFEAARCRIYQIGTKTIIRKKPLKTWKAFGVMAVLRLFGFAAWISDSRASRWLAAADDH